MCYSCSSYFPIVCYVTVWYQRFVLENAELLNPFPPLYKRHSCNSGRVVFLPHGLSVSCPKPAQHNNPPAIPSNNPIDRLNPSRSQRMRTTRTRIGCLTSRRRQAKVSPHVPYRYQHLKYIFTIVRRGKAALQRLHQNSPGMRQLR